ncbi:MAG TPA: hypothetical protein VMY06_05485 [Sedimentisphaerales bacterium]|nr:hypothetical protein [Sedimentisphaerales bacterium]
MKKYVYVWLLPFFWSICSLVSFEFPGDEYAIYAVSSMAGTWAVFLLNIQGDIHKFAFRGTITTTGIIVMLIVGFILAKLRVKLILWFVLYITLAAVILAITISSYPSIEKALSKNGSWWAYIFGSLNLGLYASVILSVIITLIVKLFEKKKIRSHKTEQA